MSNTPIEDLKTAKEVIAEKDELIGDLKARIAWLERHLFGQSSEKSVLSQPSPSGPQLDVFSERGEATPEEIKEEVSEPPRERRSAPRKPLPKNLPRTITLIDLAAEEKVCACCGNAKVCIGEDKTEKLQIVPAQVFVEEIVRPRYACSTCKDEVVQAPLPTQVLPRTNAGATLLAFLMLSKYADHLPLCRMEKIFARHGIDLPRRKTSEWMMEVADLLAPLVRLMQRKLKSCAVLGCDETSIQVLDPGGGKGKTRSAWLWVYHGDESAPYTVFDFQESRGREAPREVLEGFTGWLVSDAYAVYTSIQNDSNLAIKRAGCWAHARRKFAEAALNGDKRAEEAVRIIGRLYGVEKEARENDLDHAALQKLREEKSRPILEELNAWLAKSLAVLPKSPLGKAINYAEENWKALSEFVSDGRLPIDNNAVERAIRPVAVGRKNWLFAGSERGGKAAAIFFTLIESARRANVNLWAYITDVLTRLPSHPINRLEELLPDHWQTAATN